MADMILGNLVWKITGNTTDFDKNLKEANTKAINFGDSLKKIFTATIFTGTAIGISNIAKSFVNAASDAGETQSKFDVVFEGINQKAAESASMLVDSFGLSTTAANDLLSQTGNILIGFGLTSDKALELSTNVQKISADLVSFTNYSGGVKGASDAITKALLGEREAIKGLGIAISEADIAQLAKDRGIKGELDRQTKAMLTFELVMQRTQKAQGDFARTQDSFANSSRTLANRFEDLKVKLGKDLLPVFEGAVNIALSLVDAFTYMDTTSLKSVAVFVAVEAGLIGLIKATTGIIAISKAFIATETAKAAVVAYNTIVVTANNAALITQAAMIGKNTIVTGVYTAATWLKVAAQQAFSLALSVTNPALLAVIAATTIATGVAVAYAIKKKKEAEAIEESNKKLEENAEKSEGVSAKFKALTTNNYDFSNSLWSSLNPLEQRRKKLEEEAKLLEEKAAKEKAAAQELARIKAEQAKADAEFQAKVLSDMESEIAKVNKLENVYTDLGEEYDPVKEKQQIILDSINELIDNGWSAESKAIQKLQDQYDALGKNAEQLKEDADKEIEIEREKAAELKRIEDRKAEEEAQRLADIKEKNERLKDYVFDTASVLFSGIADLSASIYERQSDDLEAQTNRRLKALGLEEETALSKAKREYDDAVLLGDKSVIDEKNRELKKQQIYEQSKRQQAIIDYKAAKVAYGMQLTNAIISGAMAALNAYTSTAAIPLVGSILAPIAAATAAAAAAINIATIAANPPRPPQFANGGIVPYVPGLPNYGDRVTARVNPGELILNQAQQENIAGKLNGQNMIVNFTQNVGMNFDTLENGQRAAQMLFPLLQTEGLRRGATV